MKVLHIANTQFFINKLLENKIFMLKATGVDSETIAPPQIRLSRNISLMDILALKDCIKLIKQSDCKIVHTHSAKAGFIGRVAAKMCGRKCVHTVHGLPFYEGQNKFKYYLYYLLEKIASSFSSCILSQNEEDIKIMKQLGFKAKIFYEGNGIDVSGTAVFAQCRQQMRQSLGFNDDDFVCGVFARFEKVKGHMTFINAFEKFADGKKTIALFGGANMGRNESYANYVQNQISNSTADMRILGFRDDVLKLVSACDAIALTSEKEGIPRILMEAMAIGVPIVACDCEGTRELIINEESGLLYPIGDSQGISQGLNRLYEDKILAKKLSENAKKRVKEFFDEKQVISRIVEAYQYTIKN